MSETKKVGILSLALVRGSIFMVLGGLLGMLLVSGIRLVLGLTVWDPNTFGFTEPAWVVGAILGAAGFMFGTGVMSDWFAWMGGKSTSEHPHDDYASGAARYWSVSFDHKVIGIQYGVTSLVMMLIAGLFAIIFRTELVAPELQFLQLNTYNTLMSLHGITMIFSILLGVAAMSNYLVPLMIGANDMAFPRLNAFAFWLNVPAGIILLSSLFLGGFDTGWTGYPPLSARAPLGMQMFFLGVYLFGLSSIFGSLNIITTIIRLRAPGMTYFRMPIFV